MPSAWKRGASPRTDTLERMADYIGVSVADLFAEQHGDPSQTFGERLCELMDERSISAYKLSQDTGISQSGISQYRSGQIVPGLDKAQIIANYFGVPVDFLLSGKKARTSDAMFKRNFIKICASKGVSPSKVMADLGFSSSVFSEWSDSTVPRNSTVRKIADYFGVSVDFLLSADDEKKPPAEAEGEMPPYMVSVLKAADSVPADKREDFLRTVEAIARMYEKRGQ